MRGPTTHARNGCTSRRRDTKTACHEKAAERLIPLKATSMCLRYVYVKNTLQTDYKILNETLTLYISSTWYQDFDSIFSNRQVATSLNPQPTKTRWLAHRQIMEPIQIGQIISCLFRHPKRVPHWRERHALMWVTVHCTNHQFHVVEQF
jgi:hypothetical protein